VLLSHGHLDHAGYISFLDPQIPVYTSKNTMAILKTFYISRPKSLENEILELSLRDVEDPRKRKKEEAPTPQEPIPYKNTKRKSIW